MHTPSCSEVYGKCSVTGGRIATLQWWMASDSFMCVYLCICGNTYCCANSRREKLYISISWHNCCNVKFVDKLFIHEFKLCCTFLSHLAYCIFYYITDHSLMEIITELHKKTTTQYFSPICQESLELILKTWHIISLYIYTYIHIYPFQFFANFLYII